MLPRQDPPEIDRTERLKAPPVTGPVLQPEVRLRNFDEIHLPWTPEMVMAEASRCLHCADQPCVAACPLHNDIPRALWLTEKGDFDAAAAVFRETSNFSEICSRLCSQSHQCESACPHLEVGQKPVAVGRIEGFLADRYRKETGWQRDRPPSSGHRVAVVGAGPAGLTAAEFLAEKGHGVTVFDQWPSGGGVLRYGTPRFKLDHSLIRRRLTLLKELGVEFVYDTRIGGEKGIDDLFSRGFHAVFLGTGSTIPVVGEIPGIHLSGVHNSSAFLVRANVEQNLRPSEWEDPPEVGDSVVIIGAGDTAMNCSRTALRLGASTVTCIYRRSREEMPGSPRDEALAREEGAKFQWLVSPVEILGDDEGRVRGLRCLRMRLGKADESGRPSPEAIPGSEFEIPADTVVFAVGSIPDPAFAQELGGVTVSEGGILVVDPTTGRTAREMVWAGGESVTGPSPVAQAVCQARVAAEDIHEKLRWP